jgi:4-amino-4-deoxy-L-arabinose transferase-like glycosyltransferase
VQLSAREKLNTVYFLGAGILAGLAGLVTQSLIIFLICFVGLVVLFIDERGIRL